MHLLPSLIKNNYFRVQTKNFHFYIFHSLYFICNCYTRENQSITFILATVQQQAQVHCSLWKPPSQSHSPTSLVGYYVFLGGVYERKRKVTNQKNPLIPILALPGLQSKSTLPKTVQLRWWEVGTGGSIYIMTRLALPKLCYVVEVGTYWDMVGIHIRNFSSERTGLRTGNIYS